MTQTKECMIITGSNGFLGSALAKHFGAGGNQIVGLELVAPKSVLPNTDCLFCDLTSDESVQKTFFMIHELYGGRIKSVIHLAAYYSFSGKESHLYDDLTVGGTERLLRELQSCQVGQFLFSSSMLVYKPQSKGKSISEDAEIFPTWAYPKSKVKTEQLLKDIQGKIPVVILRIAGVYDDMCHCIPLAHQIKRIYERNPHSYFYPGDLDAKQSYVHLVDVVAAFDACLQNAGKLADYEVFNIGEDQALSYDETQRIIARVLFDEPWPTITIAKPLAKAIAWIEDMLSFGEEQFIKPWMIDRSDDYYVLNIEKAKSILNWQPKHSLRDSLPAMLALLKAAPRKWYEANNLHYARPHKRLLHKLGGAQGPYPPRRKLGSRDAQAGTSSQQLLIR